MKSSWKTTLCGLLAVLFAGLAQITEFPPAAIKVFALLGGVAAGAVGLFARDNGVTSEQALGADLNKPTPPK